MPEASLATTLFLKQASQKNSTLGLYEMVYPAFLFLEYFLFLCVSVQLVHAVCMRVYHVHVVCLTCILCLHFTYLCTIHMKHICLYHVHVVCMYVCVPCAYSVYVLHVHKVCMSAPCECSTLRSQKKALYVLALES